jgi:hypothetical protein
MYPSTYLKWFRRLLILGAVVAGLTASAAGARLDPGDGVSAVSANQASFVSRPPDVSDVAATIAQASPAPKVDPLAVSYLMGKGLSPSEVTSWTTGACSHQVKAASCYALLERTAATTPMPAASYYTKQQLQAMSQSWAAKAALSSLTPQERQALLQVVTANTPAVQTPAASAFGWGDFGFGAASMIGLVLVVGGCVLAARHTRRGSGVPAHVGA